MRRAHASAFEFDLARIVADFRKKDAASGDCLVSLPPKPAAGTSTGGGRGVGANRQGRRREPRADPCGLSVSRGRRHRRSPCNSPPRKATHLYPGTRVKKLLQRTVRIQFALAPTCVVPRHLEQPAAGRPSQITGLMHGRGNSPTPVEALLVTATTGTVRSAAAATAVGLGNKFLLKISPSVRLSRIHTVTLSPTNRVVRADCRPHEIGVSRPRVRPGYR